MHMDSLCTEGVVTGVGRVKVQLRRDDVPPGTAIRTQVDGELEMAEDRTLRPRCMW